MSNLEIAEKLAQWKFKTIDDDPTCKCPSCVELDSIILSLRQEPVITDAERDSTIRVLGGLLDFIAYHSSETNKVQRLRAVNAAIAAMKGRSDAGGTRLPEAVKKMLDVTCSALIVEAGATEAPFVAMIQCEKIYSEGDTAEAAIDKLAAKLEKTK